MLADTQGSRLIVQSNYHMHNGSPSFNYDLYDRNTTIWNRQTIVEASQALMHALNTHDTKQQLVALYRQAHNNQQNRTTYTQAQIQELAAILQLAEIPACIVEPEVLDPALAYVHRADWIKKHKLSLITAFGIPTAVYIIHKLSKRNRAQKPPEDKRKQLLSDVG